MLSKALRDVFPGNFLWGAAISPHQTEGNTANQWTRWEHETAAASAARAEEIWGLSPRYAELKDEVQSPLQYVSGRGVDHYTLYRRDFKLARALNLTMLRSGVEWSRINAIEGAFDPAAIAHYSRYFGEMKASGLEPVVTLFHWTIPKWFADKGGFAKSANLRCWRDYVHALVQNLDFSHVNYAVTINEAFVYSSMSYALGEFPPGERSYVRSAWVYFNLARAHRIAYRIIKAKYPHIQVGVAHYFVKSTGLSRVGRFAAWLERGYVNWWWLRLARWHDYIGINYYQADYRKGFSLMPDATPREPLNDLGWYMEPKGIGQIIRDVAKRWRGRPIMITENGVADGQDRCREWWLEHTIEAMAEEIQNGAPVIGYAHWSLMDNFEWQCGWAARFGLASVDRNTMKRTARPSAGVFARWLASGTRAKRPHPSQ